jgi:uncharacterized membrane protein YecN with MAPEG domain
VRGLEREIVEPRESRACELAAEADAQSRRRDRCLDLVAAPLGRACDILRPRAIDVDHARVVVDADPKRCAAGGVGARFHVGSDAHAIPTNLSCIDHLREAARAAAVGARDAQAPRAAARGFGIDRNSAAGAGCAPRRRSFAGIAGRRLEVQIELCARWHCEQQWHAEDDAEEPACEPPRAWRGRKCRAMLSRAGYPHKNETGRTMEPVVIVILIALVEYMVLGGLVSRARHKYGIHAPATTGNEVFERTFRAHQNTLESLVVFVPAVWIFGAYVSPWWAAGLGAVYVIGRAIYAQGYIAAAAQRSRGATVSGLASVVLLLGAFIGVVATYF